MDTLDAIFTRRSIRAFKREAVSSDDLERILQAAVSAANGGNHQPWAFVAVSNPQRLMALRSLCPGMIDTPSAAIAICLNNDRAGKSKDGQVEPMVWMDLGAAMQNILLSAHACGLGACAIGSFHAPAVTKLLNLPDHLRLSLLVSIGVPAKIPAAPPKISAGEVIFYEQYRSPDGQ